MKKIFIILSFFGVLFTACETAFDVNAEWKETTVVYGLLDAVSDTQYIKINKAFLGEGDALMMAQYSDSINFSPNDLEVNLHKLEFIPSLASYDTLMSISLDTTIMYKEDNLFAVDNNIIYRAIILPGFLKKDNNYALTIKNLKSGNEVSSTTEIISDFSFSTPIPSSFKLGFYNPSLPDSSRFRSKTVEWNKTENGEIYQLDVVFNFSENGISKSLLWSQSLEVFVGSSMQSKLEGAKFFNFLSQNLLIDNTITRSFESIDLVMTVGTQNLNTYIKVNEPLTGISQQRPQFTNINNGIGIFSSRYTYTVSNIGLTDDTKSYLADELDRNFE